MANPSSQYATFPCTKCGAELEYKPGTTQLTCAYCGAQNEIPAPAEAVGEEDFRAMVAQLGGREDLEQRVNVECRSCHASVPMDPKAAAQNCPFCGSSMVATAITRRLIKPKAILPFGIERAKARDMFIKWIAGLWFAPSDLKQYATIESDKEYKSGSGLAGLYMPYWTYDAKATTTYTGQRGDNYTVPVTVIVNGRPQTRMEVRVRWSWVSGTVQNRFDDVLVPASASLPPDKLAQLGRWDLKNLIPYRDDYLSGYRAESYTIELPTGFGVAEKEMRAWIEQTVRADIGGNQQRIASMAPRYADITFKHILLPIWVSAYRYRGRVYRFLINGRTGQLSGERPYSAWKIFFLVVSILAAVLIVVLITKSQSA